MRTTVNLRCDKEEVYYYVRETFNYDVRTLYKASLITEKNTINDIAEVITDQYYDLMEMQDDFNYDDEYHEIEIFELKYFIDDVLELLKIEVPEVVLNKSQ